MHHVQEGPDGRIYVIDGKEYLGVINSPKNRGKACDHVELGIGVKNDGNQSQIVIVNTSSDS